VQEERGPRKPKLKQQQQQTTLTDCPTPNVGGSPTGCGGGAPNPTRGPPPLFSPFSLKVTPTKIPGAHLPTPVDLPPSLARHLGLPENPLSLASFLASSPFFTSSPTLVSPPPPSLLTPPTPTLPPIIPPILPPPHPHPPPFGLHTSAFSAVRPNLQDYGNSGRLREEVGVQVLGWVVRQARISPFLTPLAPYDLLLLLTRAWPQLLLLHAAYWPLDLLLLLQNGPKVDLEVTTGLFKSDEVGQVAAILRMCRQYSLDSSELLLLSAVILLRSQPGLSSEGTVLMSVLHERAQATLQTHTATAFPGDPLRPSNLLLLVASLHRLPQ
ncbi:Nuclear receptor subfamily 2 group E member 1-like 1, partial [Homarus americanus]